MVLVGSAGADKKEEGCNQTNKQMEKESVTQTGRPAGMPKALMYGQTSTQTHRCTDEQLMLQQNRSNSQAQTVLRSSPTWEQFIKCCTTWLASPPDGNEQDSAFEDQLLAHTKALVSQHKCLGLVYSAIPP